MLAKTKTTADFLIVGGGVIGLAVARSLNLKYPKHKIVVLEKEAEVSEHTSGRNSGVLHAGFYYASDSLKATFCRKGNEAWTQYCDERGLPIRKCGKLVVPKVSFLLDRK
jgi:L-2-hydroxyglutarate oxidase LhgO